MLDKDFLDILACPYCKGDLVEVEGWLVCQNPDCGRRYPIRDGIPVLLVDEAVLPDQSSKEAD